MYEVKPKSAILDENFVHIFSAYFLIIFLTDMKSAKNFAFFDKILVYFKNIFLLSY